MKTAFFLSRVILATLPFASLTSSGAEPPPPNVDLLIDSFVTPQSAPGGVWGTNFAVGSGILGGERDFNTFLSFSANGTVPNQLQIAYPNGLLSGPAGGYIEYDGLDHDPIRGNFGGLGSVDLTQGGINDRFRFDITSIANGSATLLIELRSPFHGSSVHLNLPHSPGVFDVPFAAFQYDGSPFSDPVDFHQVGYIRFEFAMNSGDAVVMDSVVTTVPEPTTMALIAFLSGGILAMRGKALGKWI